MWLNLAMLINNFRNDKFNDFERCIYRTIWFYIGFIFYNKITW